MIENEEFIPASPACQDTTPTASALAIPPLISKAGAAAVFAWEELLLGSIRNPHTRIAYGRAVGRLLGWLEARSIPLPAVTPGIIGGYFDELQGSVPSKVAVHGWIQHVRVAEPRLRMAEAL